MATNSPGTPWWDRNRYADKRPFLEKRAVVTERVRRFFQSQGFVEVETPILQISPGNETHLHAPRTELIDRAGKPQTRYLRTSPEFAAKKLLAAGEGKLFELARVFRDRERGDLHLPEFTMLEWYRAESPYGAVMADACAVAAAAAEAAETNVFAFRGREADPFAMPEGLTVAEAFLVYAGIDLLPTIEGGEGNREALAEASRALVRVADDDTWSDIFSKILVEHVEPKLGLERMTLLYEYPRPESALARLSDSDARVVERFELYACGVELANGFGELTDAVEQRHRFELAMSEKQRRYGERYPIDEDFLAAVAVMPPASGVAMGFDRLVMLAAGATKIDQVVWMPPSDES
jgi:lysyl-tRNA synthetase class 2